MMPEPLTSLERRILDYVIEYLRRNTYQPSIREIGRRFDIKSTKTVSEYLQSLADKGWIERDPSRSRGVRLLGIDLGADTVRVPCFESLGPDGADGEPIDEIGVDRRLAGTPGSCFLVMKGDSMTGAGIYPGDLLLVEPVDEEDLDEGTIVAACVDGETTVKRYFRRGGEVVLEPANPDYAPTLVRVGHYTLAGRVTVVFRRLHVSVPAIAAPVDPEGEGASR
jgi:repressor LexA